MSCTEGTVSYVQHVDVDECKLSTHNCDALLATCSNTIGSYTCDCREGYIGTGITNECFGKFMHHFKSPNDLLPIVVAALLFTTQYLMNLLW